MKKITFIAAREAYTLFEKAKMTIAKKEPSWSHISLFSGKGNTGLASCPWGPVTANGVDLLTEIYVIYQNSGP